MSNRQTTNDTTLTGDDRAVQKALNQHLDARVESLDFNVTSKLAAARHRALDQQAAPSLWQSFFRWQSLAGGTAALAVAYLIGAQLLITPEALQPTVATDPAAGDLMADLPILAEGDDIEFYQNIEFLEWLESNS